MLWTFVVEEETVITTAIRYFLIGVVVSIPAIFVSYGTLTLLFIYVIVILFVLFGIINYKLNIILEKLEDDDL